MNHKVLNHVKSFDIVFSKLKKREPFWFVRFGDGDHLLMYKNSIGKIVGGGNKFFVTEKLQEEVIECYNIEDDNFLIGTMLNDFLPHQMMKYERKIKHDLLPNLVQRKEMLAMSCLFEMFLNNINEFAEFSKELKRTSTMFVCGYNHANIAKVYGKGVYVKIPVRNCYATIDQWYPEILANLDKVDKVILSAGFAGRVVAKRLFKAGINKMVLDVGSLSDTFVFHTDIMKKIKGRKFMEYVERQIFRNTNVLI